MAHAVAQLRRVKRIHQNIPWALHFTTTERLLAARATIAVHPCKFNSYSQTRRKSIMCTSVFCRSREVSADLGNPKPAGRASSCSSRLFARLAFWLRPPHSHLRGPSGSCPRRGAQLFTALAAETRLGEALCRRTEVHARRADPRSHNSSDRRATRRARLAGWRARTASTRAHNRVGVWLA